MTVSRRRFLAGTAAAGMIGATGPLGARAHVKKLRAQAGSTRIAPKPAPETAIWGYGGRIPGPEIRVRQGQRLIRRFINDLPQPSTIHWHGIRIDNAMDGVPHLTQPPVPPGGHFLYDFEVPDAGTYWYHSHNRTWEQMARGLFGPLIVEETSPPEVDREKILAIDDWRLIDQAVIKDDFGNAFDWSHAGRIGNTVTVNGKPNPLLAARHNERIRLRMINTANARIFEIGLQGLKGWIIALDGQPLDRPMPVERHTLGPAQRVDIIVDVTAASGTEAFLLSFEKDGAYSLVTFAVDGAARTGQLPPPAPLPPNPVPPLGPLEKARKVRLLMEGGAKGGMGGAMLGGEFLAVPELAKHGKFWSFNGAADTPKKPLFTGAIGETVRITITNDTFWPHAMHTHGYHFRKVEPDGSIGPLRDTLLMIHQETTEIAFYLDNPGDWLLHCHMLEHAEAGMRTWFRVTA